MVPDIEEEIVDALNAMRARHTYLFTTGGIGPTHDDITADSVAKAFGVGIGYHPEAVALLKEMLAKRGTELNEARLRMARIPDGADLITNAVSAAPGFRIGNVHVMAGVPAIMQAMLDGIAPTLKTGAKVLSETIRADAREGDIGTPLAEIAKAHPGVMIGSYPFWDDKSGPNTNSDRALARSAKARRRQGRGRDHARTRQGGVLISPELVILSCEPDEVGRASKDGAAEQHPSRLGATGPHRAPRDGVPRSAPRA